MFKPKTLLKVVSVIFIIMGILGGIGVIVSYTVLLPRIESLGTGVDMSMFEQAFTPLNLVMSVISSVSSVVAGFFGFTGKSSKWAAVFAGIYTVLLVVSVVQTFMMGTFTAFIVVDFILPALYWWGLYQSK